RSLNKDGISDASLWIQPKIGSGLETAAERDQHVAGNSSLSKTKLLGAQAIDVDHERRGGNDLVNMHIHGARDLCNSHLTLPGDIVILWVLTDDLDVDWRRHPKVQNLAHYVGRLVIESHIRIQSFEFVPEGFRILLGGSMTGIERDKNLAVFGPDRRTVAVGDVNTRIRQADFVQNDPQLVFRDRFSDRIFHQGETDFGFLDPSTGCSLNMQAELAGIDLGEEVFSHQWK